jgi:DNA-binding PadR family transcriptional regulator
MKLIRYFVLLALSKGVMYPYAIRKQIIGDSLGVYVKDGTLYRVLGDLVRAGLIEETVGMNSWRTSYMLSDVGRRRLKAENGVLWHAAQLGRQRVP